MPTEKDPQPENAGSGPPKEPFRTSNLGPAERGAGDAFRQGATRPAQPEAGNDARVIRGQGRC